MTRRIPSRPVLSAMLVVALLAGVGLTSYSAPADAAPSQEARAEHGPSITSRVASVGTAEGSGGRFAFSVLNQFAATQIDKFVQSPLNVTSFTPGQTLTFRVSASNLQRVGGPQGPGGESVLRDFIDPNLEFISGVQAAGTTTAGTGVCVLQTGTPATGIPTPPGLAAPIAGTAQVVDCFAGAAFAGGPAGTVATVVFDITVMVRGTAVGGTLGAGDTACVRDAANNFTICDQQAITIAVAATATPTAPPATPTPTRTVTPIATATPTATPTSLTVQQAIALVAATGQVGVPCTTSTLGNTLGGIGFGGIPGLTGFNTGQITGTGGVCTATGNVTGTFTPNGLGGGTFSFTTTVPGGVPAGVTPVVVLSTTAGLEGFACSTVHTSVGMRLLSVEAQAGTTVTCTGTTVGIPLQGSTVTVVFLPGITQTGTITGPGAVNVPTVINCCPGAPLLPPPPLQFIPPPPPPLLPPPPPAPMTAARPTAAFPEVPVIPEADSLFLLAGGLAVLGGLVGFRSLRRRRDDA